MGNVLSYIKWRGDLDLKKAPFNKVDNLVLSLLAYTDFEGIVPPIETGDTVSIKEAYGKYLEKKEQDKQRRKNAHILSEELLKELSGCVRFRDTRLGGYTELKDDEIEETQFAALYILLPDGTVYVSYRGTDDSIVGWKEDFSISFRKVAAQKHGEEYLRNVMEILEEPVRVGGHSKGGYLAVSSAMMCREKQERILEIYNNDGPGICPDLPGYTDYLVIRDKIIRIVPEFSIIGQLFNDEGRQYIVQSSANGILAHDGFTWETEGNHFRTAEHLDRMCQIYNRIFDKWIEDVELPQRKQFVDDFFGALGAGGAKTISEVANGGIQGFEAVLLSMGKSRRFRIVAGKLVKSIVYFGKKINPSEVFHTKGSVQGLFFFIAGIFFLSFPEQAQKVIGISAAAGIFLYACYRLYLFWLERKAGGETDRIRLIFYSLVAALMFLCIIKNEIVVISTNLILGVLFCFRSWKQGKRASGLRAQEETGWKWPLADCAVCGILGMVLLLFAGSVQAQHILASGAYFIVYGIIQIGREMYENALYEYKHRRKRG